MNQWYNEFNSKYTGGKVKKYLTSSKKPIFIITSLLAGLALFLIQFSLNINSGVMNENFHKNLFEKHDIYNQTKKVLNNSTSVFINNLKKNTPEIYNQHADTFALLEKSLTPIMIKMNLDTFRHDILEYFKGKKMFLPDIYLNSNPKSEKPIYYENEDTMTTTTNMLANIDKINLSAILMYINRNDISDNMSVIKFLYYIVNSLPGFCVPMFLILLFINLLLAPDIRGLIKWIGLALLSGSIIGLAAGIGLYVFTYFMMPQNIYLIAASLPFNYAFILSYLHDCLIFTGWFFIILNICLLCISLGIFKLLKILYSNRLKESAKKSSSFKTAVTDEALVVDAINSKKHLIKYGLYLVIIITIISFIGFRINIFRKDYNENDFSTAFSELTGSNMVTEIIPAKNDTVYSLVVKFIDSKTSIPVSNVKLNITSVSTISGKAYNINTITATDGSVKLSLGKGTFRLSFLPDDFPAAYEMPSPFFFDMKSAGTTIITTNLHLLPEKLSIIEIEILDNKDKPVQNIELNIDQNILSPEYPNKIYSYTNPEGIAVFKMPDGNYNINFVEEKFPKEYILPPPFEVNTAGNAVTRYTIRLSAFAR
jgi:hypothetical protein